MRGHLGKNAALAPITNFRFSFLYIPLIAKMPRFIYFYFSTKKTKKTFTSNYKWDTINHAAA